jgi:hypothetical protein
MWKALYFVTLSNRRWNFLMLFRPVRNVCIPSLNRKGGIFVQNMVDYM